MTGHVLWQKDLANVSNVSFSNKSLKNYFIHDGNKLCCHDRNGDEMWAYSSEDILEDFEVISSGMMTGLYSNNYFHILDENGEQAWSYYALSLIHI
mgnify:CR=1 FL=1